MSKSSKNVKHLQLKFEDLLFYVFYITTNWLSDYIISINANFNDQFI